MKGLILVLLLALTICAQEPNTSRTQKSLIEIDASLSAIQDLLNDLTLKKSALERERKVLLQGTTTDKKPTFDGNLTIVVRVSGERSVVLLVNGREREVYLSGLVVKLGRRDDAIALLNRGLANGVTYPRCADPACFEVELFTDKTQPSLNCMLVDSGVCDGSIW